MKGLRFGRQAVPPSVSMLAAWGTRLSTGDQPPAFPFGLSTQDTRATGMRSHSSPHVVAGGVWMLGSGKQWGQASLSSEPTRRGWAPRNGSLSCTPLSYWFLQCLRVSFRWFLLLRSTGSGVWTSVVAAHELSCSEACGIFPDPGLNPYPLHWQSHC